MAIAVKPATKTEKPIIHALLQLYLAELSHFPDEQMNPRDSNGVYHYRYLDAYWQEPGIRFPYLLYDGNNIAGFSLVRKDAGHWEMSEFYVKPLFRRRGLGESCALKIISQHPGKWTIEYNRHNMAGRSLWQKIALKYSGGEFEQGKAENSHDYVRFTVSDNQELLTYYNERAHEYEAFYEGRFPTGTRTPELYRADTKAIQQLLPHYVNGDMLDIACGTAFWLPWYHTQCASITLIDQAESTLVETRKKIDQLDIQDKARIIRGDIFKDIPSGQQYDTALAGFLISHFTDEEITGFLKIVKQALKPGGRFIIIDSVWGEEVAAYHKNQSGTVTRRLYDGREFRIFKRFFTRDELLQLTVKNGLELEIAYWVKVFFLASGYFRALKPQDSSHAP